MPRAQPKKKDVVYDVVIILGSKNDYEQYVKGSGMTDILTAAGASWTMSVLSAHRHADALADYCLARQAAGSQIFIGIAGMSAQLPGAIAAALRNRRLVIGVALPSKDMPDGADATLSITRMPQGTPVGYLGLAKSGLNNAAIYACQILAVSDERVRRKLDEYLDQVAQGKPPEYDFTSSGM